jgi:hypothetical protein
MTIRVAALALAAVAFLSTGAGSQALYQGPWCAIVMIGEGAVAERCDMRSFEMCQAEIRGQGSATAPRTRAITRRSRNAARNSACNSRGAGT